AANYRQNVTDLLRFEVRNVTGSLVPMGAFTHAVDPVFPPFLERFNLYPSTLVQVVPRPDVSTGDGIALMEQLSRDQLPPGMTMAWSGVALQAKQVEGQIVGVFALALLVVYLILAALYESWTYPVAIVLTIPCA